MKALRQMARAVFGDEDMRVLDIHTIKSEKLGCHGKAIEYKFYGGHSNLLVFLTHNGEDYVGSLPHYDIMMSGWSLDSLASVKNMGVLMLFKYEEGQEMAESLKPAPGSTFIFLHENGAIVPPFHGSVDYNLKDTIRVSKPPRQFVIRRTESGKLETHEEKY